VFPIKYYYSDKIKEDEMNGACSMHEPEKFIQSSGKGTRMMETTLKT
jgi:hypothetical protein